MPARDRIPEMLRRALRISWRGLPGVAHLGSPEDILHGPGEIDDPAIRVPHRYPRATTAKLARLVHRLAPTLYVRQMVRRLSQR